MGLSLGALAVLALVFAIEMGAAGQAAGAAVARIIAVLAQPVLGLMGHDLVRDGVELRDPAAGWAVRVSEVCDGMGLVVALIAAVVVLAPGRGAAAAVWIGWRILAGVAAIQVFNFLRVVALAQALGQGGKAFGALHDHVFPLLSVLVIAAVLIRFGRLAAFAVLAAVLWLLWVPVSGAVSALLVPPANAVLAGFAPTGVGEIARSQGLWSVGTMFVAASDPLQLYRAPIEPVHFTLALPVVAAAAVMVRRPGWLLLALPLMLAALCVAAPVAVMALADARAPVTVLLPAGDGSFVAADYALPETQRAVLRLAQNTIVHFLLLVLPVLVLSHRRAPA